MGKLGCCQLCLNIIRLESQLGRALFCEEVSEWVLLIIRTYLPEQKAPPPGKDTRSPCSQSWDEIRLLLEIQPPKCLGGKLQLPSTFPLGSGGQLCECQGAVTLAPKSVLPMFESCNIELSSLPFGLNKNQESIAIHGAGWGLGRDDAHPLNKGKQRLIRMIRKTRTFYLQS